jgi:hypothetical protein
MRRRFNTAGPCLPEPDPLAKGLVQLDGHLERLGLDRGVLVLFDRRPGRTSLPDRVRFDEATSPSGRPVRILRG